MKGYEKIPINGLTNEEWLKLRKSGIGGSDIATVCGANPFSSILKLFYTKTTDTVTQKDSESIRIGHDLEEYVAQRFTEATGLKVRKSNFMYRSNEHPFMIADVDRLIVGEDAGLECKTTNAFNKDAWENGNAPLHYILQCYWYMAVTGKKTWFLACVILGVGFKYIKLDWNQEIIDELIARGTEFWNKYVLTNTLPMPDGSANCDEIINELFSTSNHTEINLIGFDDKLERRQDILKSIEELEKEQKQIEQELKMFLQDNEYASNDKFKVAWTNVDTTRLDSKRIKEEMPEVYNAYSKTSTSRRLQIKVA